MGNQVARKLKGGWRLTTQEIRARCSETCIWHTPNSMVEDAGCDSC